MKGNYLILSPKPVIILLPSSSPSPVFCFVLFLFFGCIGILTQGFIFARQVLYCLSHVSNSFCSGYFGDRISLFAQAGLKSCCF
jgi:hypothetical protein